MMQNIKLFTVKSDIIIALQETLHKDWPPLALPSFCFATNPSSLSHNKEILQQYNFDFTKTLHHLLSTHNNVPRSWILSYHHPPKFSQHLLIFPFVCSLLTLGKQFFLCSPIWEPQCISKLHTKFACWGPLIQSKHGSSAHYCWSRNQNTKS